MSPELIKYSKKVDSLRDVLKQHGFEDLEFFWYSDGFYNARWADMSVAVEEPDRKESLTYWQFGFKSLNDKIKRLWLHALHSPYYDETFSFRFELRYFPEVQLHERVGYFGPTSVLTICDILEEDLPNLQKYINYLLNIV
jgi:hypothetical protein